MKREDIYDGISGISPQYIEEAESHVFSARKKSGILKWAAAAAIFVILGGVGVYAATGGFNVKKLSIGGYEISANISRIPMRKITGEVNEASEAIRKQYENSQPFSNLFPGSFYKNVSSAEEAAAYVGYDRLQIPAFPYEEADITVAVTGDADGRLSQIQIMRDCVTKKIAVQNWTTIFAEHYAGDVFEVGAVGNYSEEMKSFVTATGLRCIVFESDAQVPGRHGLTAYIATGDVVYMCHTAFNTADRAEAEKIIRDWAESLK